MPTGESKPVQIAVLTVSDTRTLENDASGRTLVERLEAAGHRLIARELVVDDVTRIASVVRAWIQDGEVDVVLVTGGTGITERDVTPEALTPLFEKDLPGFGELFRWLGYSQIGTSTIHSRAVAGIAGGTLVFALPGSPGACRDAWDQILVEQFDVRHRPCNFVTLMPRLNGKSKK